MLVALAWGLRGATLADAMLAVIAVLNTAQGEGPFAAYESFEGESVLEVQLYIGAAALLTLLMAAMRTSQDRTVARGG